MAVASFPSPAVVFREEQTFGWWAYALLGVVELASWLTLYWVFERSAAPVVEGEHRALVSALFAGSCLCVPIMVVIGFFKMTTEVTPSDLRVWFGWIPTYRKALPITLIQKVDVVRYRPLREYGGWGIRVGWNGDRALTARGNLGVRLEMLDGATLLLGSQRPEALAIAIENAIRPVS